MAIGGLVGKTNGPMLPISHWLTLSATRSQVLTWPEGPAIGGAFHAGIEAQHVQRGGFG